jgi:hypothetical protein
VSLLLREGLVQHHVGEIQRAEGTKPRVTAHVEPPLAEPVFYDVIARLGREPVLGLFPDMAASLAKVPVRLPLDWSVLDTRPAPPVTVVTTTLRPRTGYHVTNGGGANMILNNQFRSCDLEANPTLGRTLTLFVNLDLAKARAQDRYGDDGVVIEVRFQGEPRPVPSLGEDAPPAGVPIKFSDEGIEYVALRDLDSILAPLRAVK